MRKFVIDTTTKQVKRHGFVDFANENIFDSLTEEVIEKDYCPAARLQDQELYWNATTEEFQTYSPV